MGPISEYETKVIQKLLNDAESWIGLNDSHIKTLQEFQDNFLHLKESFPSSSKRNTKRNVTLRQSDPINEVENSTDKIAGNCENNGETRQQSVQNSPSRGTKNV